MTQSILVTGAAGFIGMHVSRALLEQGKRVVGVDNLNSYYSLSLKKRRLKILKQYCNFHFYKTDLKNRTATEKVFKENKIKQVCHLAAQAGVRYSIEEPFAYLDSNLIGFQNIIHSAMVNKVENFVYASSSSVYGKNKKVPFSVDDRVDNPVSLYAATKRCNELVAYTYNHVYGLPTTGLRFFTVYGTWGRPDMALFLFTKAILAGEPITVYNYGRMQRDFTYVSDIVDGILAALKHPQPFGIYNLGNSQRVSLNKFIGHIEQKLGIKAKKKLIPMQMGDVPCTYADISSAQKDLHFSPKIGIKEGINDFIDWYRSYYKE